MRAKSSQIQISYWPKSQSLPKNELLFFVFVSSSADSIENWEQLSFLKFGNGLLKSITKTKMLYILYSVTQYSQTLPKYSFQINLLSLQVILFEIDCVIFCMNRHELFCQFISWTNWVNSGKFMDNCWMNIISSLGWYKKSLRRSHNY